MRWQTSWYTANVLSKVAVEFRSSSVAREDVVPISGGDLGVRQELTPVGVLAPQAQEIVTVPDPIFALFRFCHAEPGDLVSTEGVDVGEQEVVLGWRIGVFVRCSEHEEPIGGL